MEAVISGYREAVFQFLDGALKEYGVDYTRELMYRFAIAQFRSPLGFTISPEELTMRISTNLQSDFGAIFEQFAEKAFEQGFSEAEINNYLKRFLLDFWKEKIG